jgi:TRAP-type C4-dicarboxylate transport system permease small subunit
MKEYAMDLEPPVDETARAAPPAAGKAASALRRHLAGADAAVAAVEEAVAVVLFYGLLAGFIVQVFARFVIRYPLPWSEEFCSQLFVWLGALGAAIGVRWGSHFVAFDLQAKLRGWPRRVVVAIVKIAVGAVAVVLLVDGVQFTREGMAQLTPIMNLPAAIGDAAVPVSAALILWHLACTWILGASGAGFENLLGFEQRDA